jgi:hypothetical protein
VLFDHPIHGSTLALRLDESFGTDSVLRASQSAIRNLRAIGDLDEEWFAPDSDCAKDGSGCVGQQPEIGEKGSVGRRNVFGCGVGCDHHTLLDLSGLVAWDSDLRLVQCGIVSLIAYVR